MRKLLLFISLFLSLNSQTNSLLAVNLDRVNNTTKPNYKANTVDLSLRKRSFDSNWLFSLKDNKEAKSIQFDDSSWRIVNLPHDWSIEGNMKDGLDDCGLVELVGFVWRSWVWRMGLVEDWR